MSVPLEDIPLGIHHLSIDPPQPIETAEYRLNHVMLPITDPAASLKFYGEGFGLRTIFTMNTGASTVYFLAHAPHPHIAGSYPAFSTMGTHKGLLELYYIHPPPQASNCESSSNSNSNNDEGDSVSTPRAGHPSIGHIGFTVPNVQACIDRLRTIVPTLRILKPLGDAGVHSLGVHDSVTDRDVAEGFKKALEQVAFVEDPDGHAIEVMPLMIAS